MVELPVLAFDIIGCNQHIRLNVDEVFGYPNEISYGGGYGAKGTININVGPYKVCTNHYFTTGELYTFFQQLQKCYDNIKGEAVLLNIEHALNLKISFGKFGNVVVSGKFQERQDVSNILYFEMDTDQAAIFDALTSLKVLCRLFGDEKGVAKNI